MARNPFSKDYVKDIVREGREWFSDPADQWKAMSPEQQGALLFFGSPLFGAGAYLMGKQKQHVQGLKAKGEAENARQDALRRQYMTAEEEARRRADERLTRDRQQALALMSGGYQNPNMLTGKLGLTSDPKTAKKSLLGY